MSDEKTIDKIRKLLAVAEGQANEKESQVAMEMASRLMMQHGIERDQIKTDDVPELIDGNRYDFTNTYMRDIAWGCEALFGVKLMMVRWKKSGVAPQYYFLGRTLNVRAAEETMIYLALQLEAQYKRHLPAGMTKKARAEYRKSFKNACAHRIHTRCREIAEEQSKYGFGDIPTHKALVVDHRASLKRELDDYLKAKNVPSSTFKDKKLEGRGAYEGYAAGDAVEINRTMS